MGSRQNTVKRSHRENSNQTFSNSLNERSFRSRGNTGSSFEVEEIKGKNDRGSSSSLFSLFGGFAVDDQTGNNNGGQQKVYKLQLKNKPNEKTWLISLMRWTFITSFSRLILLYLIIYTALCTGFAVFILMGHFLYEGCVISSENNESTEALINAFALSWTTFSTVGYGSNYPTTNGGHCFFTHSVVSLEAFIGILYAGFCGAILFAKVLKVQHEAPVEFSAGICLRNNFDKNPGSSSNGILSDCPRLEFRVVNKLGNVRGRGAILDATVKCSMELCNHMDIDDDLEFCSDKRQINRIQEELFVEDASISDAHNRGSLRSLIWGRGGNSEQLPRFDSRIRKKSLQSSTNVIRAVDKRNNALIDLRKRFVDIKFDYPEHPCFSNVWSFSHILDENSPLLKPSVRKYVKNEVWPLKYRNREKLHECLVNFKGLLLSLSGICSDSEGEVSARKKYRFEDICVCYRFAENIEIIQTPNGSREVVVDFYKTNLVIEENEMPSGVFFNDDIDNKCGE